MDRIEAAVSEALARWVREVQRRARLLLGIIALLTIGLGTYAALELGINSDNVTLIAEHLEARQNYLEFARSFPNIENVLLVVIDGETPEIAREATTTMQERLSQNHELFNEVYIPGAGEFFERNGLLYRDLDDLDEFSLQMARVQPILTALEREPTVANLASLIQRGLEAAEEESEFDAEELSVLLDQVGNATVQAYREFPLEISWEEILLRGSSVETVTRWVLVIDPVLNFDSLFAAADPMAEIERVAEANDLDPDHGVTIRITGNPALNYEEMAGILWDVGMGGVICFFFVIFVLIRALRSLRLVAAAVLTLLVGLVWTGAFAAASVGSLNLISVAFAILFIGLGVDFTIHLGMAYADALRRHMLDSELSISRGIEVALDEAIRHVGSSLVLCTATTAIGFYVFIPTDNIGVAELGLIAGTGMIFNLLLTTTLFPALLSTVLRLDPKRDLPREMSFRSTWWRKLTERPRIVSSIAFVLLVFGAWKTFDVQFDANVVRMRDPETQSVQAFNDLLEEAGARSPWPLDTIEKDLDAATSIARKVEGLSVVEFAVTLADYVPTDQADKIMMLEDVAMILDAPRGTDLYEESPSTEEQIVALQGLHDFLATTSIDEGTGPLAASMRSLRQKLKEFLDLAANDQNPEASLERLETSLLGGLEKQLARLREATLVEPIELDDLPKELRERMLTEDGRARVQIFPKDKLTSEAAFTRFAKEVQTIAPNATGLPMNMIAFADATRDSFREALVYAVALISTILFLLWRRVEPVLLVIAPLVLSNALTLGLMATFGIAFNFVNVVVIPLLLGIGVDSGIHLVHRAETLARLGLTDHLLASTTARAVFYSALTTTVSFGTLALSSHQGVSSLGVVLTIGMMLTVVCNLVVLPALIALRRDTN
jgi:hopanoid biosynthesis associated RND transporter like protein HpnN